METSVKQSLHMFDHISYRIYGEILILFLPYGTYFSGDTDGRVPVTGTQYSINKMNLTVRTLWHPWYNAAEVII